MRAHKSVGDVPHGTIESGFPINWIKAAGHLAVWAVMYAIGVALMLGELLGFPLGWEALLYVALCSHAGYLFDRLKFRDSDLDPADLLADPDRHGFLRSRSGWIRVLMVLEWIAAMVVGLLLSTWLSVLVVGGVVVGYVYSGWPPSDRARLKDVSGLKAWLVSIAVVGLGCAALLAQVDLFGGIDSLLSTLSERQSMCILGMLLVVCGDAVLCDLDDSASDRVYRTRSLPVMVGDRWSALSAVGLLVVGSGVILLGLVGGDLLVGGVWFVGLVLLSGVVILVAGPMIGGRRDWVDGRMLIAALVAMEIISR
ncbi:MAG: hypothetical protein JJ974_08090 [Phycisphaerales bacterium]|nr:hypothetical protein [Phycisphaerales bacterium]